MQGLISSNEDIIVEKSSKEGEKDIVNNEVASIPVKAIDTNENNEEEIEFKENVAEDIEIPEGHILDKNGNIVPIIIIDEEDIPVVNPSDYIKDDNVGSGNNNSNSGSNGGGTAVRPSESKPVENKPVQNKPTQNKPVETPKPQEPSKPVDTPKPQEPNKHVETPKPEHVHNWVAVTEQVKHDEVGHWEDVVVKEAWTESVPVYEEKEVAICNGCGADITNNIQQHIKDNVLAGNTACGGWHSEWKQVQTGTNTINHPAVVEKKWIVDKAAWVETVTTGHTCSGCGAKK
ncbi:hypothetical protein [uncultured Clostridium sp.]|uniref:hypothetical protein n=1 Tax=uncultured Clostridium sp. TaxID=59620 RepID=UPI002614381F|nr:hypothetical protein [uncultured Clostridium sp.]